MGPGPGEKKKGAQAKLPSPKKPEKKKGKKPAFERGVCKLPPFRKRKTAKKTCKENFGFLQTPPFLAQGLGKSLGLSDLARNWLERGPPIQAAPL